MRLSKVCSTCKKMLPLTGEFFHRNRAVKDGWHCSCKLCKSRHDSASYYRHKVAHNAACKKRYEKNREAIKANSRKYYHANTDKVQAYKLRNRDKRNAQSKAWKKANPEKVKALNCKRDVKMEALKQQMTDVLCVNEGCEKYLTAFQIYIGIKHCCKQCAAVHSNGGVQYNPLACQYFAQFDKANSTSGRYATNGGEHFIPELGYWVDYYNPELKLIIEWDEDQHYIGGTLKPKDIQRQEEIQTLLPVFEFKRIRQSDILTTL